MSEKKKAVITILGLAGGKIEKDKDNIKYINFKTKAKYTFNSKEAEYTNTLPLWIEKYQEYKIVPIYTDIAKNLQIELCKENEDKDISELFNDDYNIIDENNYNEVFRVLNRAIKNFDECIVDLTHGFRHIPILATISLIMSNIKDTTKIKHIWFAKEKTKPEKGIQGEYEIIDLKEYLELANLSFIITNFQDNYTISKHIEVKNQKYNQLIKDMNKFSSDVMSLSLENLLDNSARKLKETINNILEKDDILLKKELEMLSSHLDENFVKKSHRYETYFYMAKVLKEKGYLIHSLALVFESIGFYLKSNFQKYNNNLNIYIEEKENRILSNKKLDYYKLTDACRSFLFFDKYENRNDFFNKAQIDIIYQELDKIQDLDKFKKFALRVKKLRNNLLHANSGNKLNNTQNDIDKILEDFESFCIDKNILSSVKSKKEYDKQISVSSTEQNVNTEEQIMPNGERRKVKKLKKRLDQTDKDKQLLKEGANKLAGIFNNR